MSESPASYYEALGVPPGASDADIDDAHRRLSAQSLSGAMPPVEAEATLTRVREAYATLGDPARRAVYDQGRRPPKPFRMSADAPTTGPVRDGTTSGTAPPVARRPTREVAAPTDAASTVDPAKRPPKRSHAARARPPVVLIVIAGLGLVLAVAVARSDNPATQAAREASTKTPAVMALREASTMTPAPEPPTDQAVRAVLDSILQCDLIAETFTAISSAEVVRPCGTDEWVTHSGRNIVLLAGRAGDRSVLMGIQVAGVVPVAVDEVVVGLVERWGSPPSVGATASDDRLVPQRVTLRSVSGQWKLVSVEFEPDPDPSTSTPLSLGNDPRDATATDHLGAALALRDAGNLAGAEKEISEVLALGYTTVTNDALTVRAEIRKAAMTRPTAVPQPSVTPVAATTQVPQPTLTAIVPQATLRVATPATTAPSLPKAAPTANNPPQANVPPTVRVATPATTAPSLPKAAPTANNPPQANVPPAGFFTVGSTKDEVLAAQGTPTTLGDTLWTYGLSDVYFSGGRVINWNDPARNLKVRMIP